MALLLLLAGVRGGAFDIRHTVEQFVRCCCLLFLATTRMIEREAFIRIIIYREKFSRVQIFVEWLENPQKKFCGCNIRKPI